MTTRITPLPATNETYQGVLFRLLPRGAAWTRVLTSRLGLVLLAIGDELARVHNRVLDLVITEADPRTCNPADGTISDTGYGGLLEDLERVLGITPDAAATTAERRAAVHAALIAQGGCTAAYMIAIAAALGWTVTIDEPLGPWRCDSSGCDEPLYDEAWQFVWIVHAEYTIASYFRCDSPCDSPLVDYGTSDLVTLFEALKPAHTTIHWSFTGPTP